MMLNLITADWHIDRRGWETADPRGGLEEWELLFAFFLSVCKQHKVGRFIHLGDVYHRPNPTSLYHDMMLRFVRDVQGLANAEFIIIEGNHDYNQNGVSALMPLKTGMLATIITKDSEDLTIGEHFVCFPHIGRDDNVGKFENRFREQASGRVALGHLQMAGAATGSENFLLGGGAVSLPHLPCVNSAILGHIHKPQTFVSNGVEVTYVGSSRCIDFGERGEKKRVLLYDDELGKMVSVETPCYPYVEVNIHAPVSNGKVSFEFESDEVRGAVVKANVLTDSVGIDVDRLRGLLTAAGCKHVHSVNVYREGTVVVRDASMTRAIPPQQALGTYIDGLAKHPDWMDAAKRKSLLARGVKVLEKVAGDVQ